MFGPIPAKVSLVVALRNAPFLADELVYGIQRQTLAITSVIVIGFGSDDGSVDEFRKASFPVPSNRPYEFNHGGACNLGVCR